MKIKCVSISEGLSLRSGLWEKGLLEHYGCGMIRPVKAKIGFFAKNMSHEIRTPMKWLTWNYLIALRQD